MHEHLSTRCSLAPWLVSSSLWLHSCSTSANTLFDTTDSTLPNSNPLSQRVFQSVMISAIHPTPFDVSTKVPFMHLWFSTPNLTIHISMQNICNYVQCVCTYVCPFLFPFSYFLNFITLFVLLPAFAHHPRYRPLSVRSLVALETWLWCS